MSFFTSIRLSSCIRWAATGKISVKFVIGDFYENWSRKKKNAVKEGAQMSGTLCDANRMYAQISLLSKIYIIYIIYVYNIKSFICPTNAHKLL